MILKRKKELLQKIRKNAIIELERRYIINFGDDTFTCDTCQRAASCEWVYDLYNTGGDCIWLK